jgi:biotin transport system ATP-binding protein
MGLPKREIKRRVASILEAYGLGGMGERPAHLLSGGEKKLLSVLSVVIMEPKVIVLDEPFASLDMLNRERLRRLLNELPQMLITITHDLDTVLGYERAIWFDRGRIAADGAPGTVIPQYFKKTREWFQSISPETQAFTGFIPA